MSIINFAVNKNQNTNWSDPNGQFCQKRQKILPTNSATYCFICRKCYILQTVKWSGEYENEKQKYPDEHWAFQYSSGYFFVFIGSNVNDRKSICVSHFFQMFNDLLEHWDAFFYAIKTVFFHIFQIVTENFHQFGFIDIQYKNFSDIVFEDHRSEVSADAEMKIGRKMI